MSKQPKRIVFQEDEEVKGEIEFFDNIPFLHVTFHKKSISAHKKVLRMFEDAKEFLAWAGHEFVFSFTPNPKYAEALKGWAFADTFEEEGTHYYVYYWETGLCQQ